jgi:transposase
MNPKQAIPELKEAMRKTSDRRDFERYQAVLLFLEGYQKKEISRIIGRCTHTVGHYVRAYETGGIDGLLERGVSPGKPSRLTPEQKQALRETVAYKTPDEVGFSARFNWTLMLAAQFIEREWGETYTQKGVSKLLHALGLSYTRPTYTLKKADPAKQETFRQDTFPAVKKS